jgi:hypothetical protein
MRFLFPPRDLYTKAFGLRSALRLDHLHSRGMAAAFKLGIQERIDNIQR